jgi:hypothetical protein
VVAGRSATIAGCRILRAGGGWSITHPTSTGTAQAQAEVERAAGVQRDALGYRPSQ